MRFNCRWRIISTWRLRGITFPLPEADIVRTRAGASFRGVNTGVVQNTTGGGVGGFLGSGVAARVPVVRQAARAVRVRAPPDLQRQHSAPEPRCSLMILP